MSLALAHCDMASERDVDAVVHEQPAAGGDASDCPERPVGFLHSDKVCTCVLCRNCASHDAGCGGGAG